MGIVMGIDIGKSWLEIAMEDRMHSIENNRLAIERFLEDCQRQYSLNQVLMVCEATGGYERLFVAMSKGRDISVQVAHPNKIRAFAKSKGLLAKTDKIDALLIRDYAQTMRPQITPSARSEASERVAGVLKRRQQLIEDRSREQGRIDTEVEVAIKRSMQAHIQWIDQEIQTIESLLEPESQETSLKKKPHPLIGYSRRREINRLELDCFFTRAWTGHAQTISFVSRCGPI